MTGILLFGVEPIHLLTDDLPTVSGGTHWTNWLLPGAVVGATVLVGAMIYAAWRVGLGRDRGERAFRALSRKLRLGRPQRETIRDIAAVVGAPPVALLLCRSAFTRAIGRREEAGPPDPTERSRLLELEHTVFG